MHTFLLLAPAGGIPPDHILSALPTQNGGQGTRAPGVLLARKSQKFKIFFVFCLTSLEKNFNIGEGYEELGLRFFLGGFFYAVSARRSSWFLPTALISTANPWWTWLHLNREDAFQTPLKRQRSLR